MERREALEILGLTGNETKKEIAEVYKKIDEKYNPFQNPNNPKSKEILEAFSTLQKKEKENVISTADEQAYDEYKKLFDNLEAEAMILRISLPKEYYNYTNKSNRGKVSEKIYQSLKISLQSDFDTIKKDVETYDSFVNYLKTGDINNPLYSSMLEKLNGKRGILSASEINKERLAFVNEFNANYQDKLTDENAFATFQKLYKEMQEDLRIHYGETIKPRENLNVESKEYSPEVYQELIDDLKECKKYYEAQKEWRFSIFKEKLAKRNIDVNFYLSLRKFENGDILTYDTLTIPKLNEMLKSFARMDEIESLLSSLNITLEEYLKKFGKTIETVTNKELEIILEEVQKLGSKVSTIQDTLDAQDMMRR